MHKIVNHLFQRKRKYENLEPYPHPHKLKAQLDKFIFVLAGMWPLANMPQVIQIYITKDVSGLSLLSWSIYVFFTIPWFVYGIMHKEKLIIFTYFLNFILYSFVVIGILLYG